MAFESLEAEPVFFGVVEVELYGVVVGCRGKNLCWGGIGDESYEMEGQIYNDQ